MKIIEPSATIEMVMPANTLEAIESAGRTCYKSEGRTSEDSSSEFVRMLLKRGHESVLEHGSMRVRFVVDRGVSHELVRHRLMAISQESTRYCNYASGKFDGEVTVIRPCFWAIGSLRLTQWANAVSAACEAYKQLIADGASPQEARSVLPNSLKTELVVTANLREWRHIFQLRTSAAAHPQMRQVMRPLLDTARNLVPIIFDDVGLGTERPLE